MKISEDESLNPQSLGMVKNFPKVKFFGKSCIQKLVYLRDISFSMLNGQWFSNAIEQNLVSDIEKVYDRFLTEWATVGVISSLLFTLVLEPVSSKLENETDLYFNDVACRLSYWP